MMEMSSEIVKMWLVSREESQVVEQQWHEDQAMFDTRWPLV